MVRVSAVTSAPWTIEAPSATTIVGQVEAEPSVKTCGVPSPSKVKVDEFSVIVAPEAIVRFPPTVTDLLPAPVSVFRPEVDLIVMSL